MPKRPSRNGYRRNIDSGARAQEPPLPVKIQYLEGNTIQDMYDSRDVNAESDEEDVDMQVVRPERQQSLIKGRSGGWKKLLTICVGMLLVIAGIVVTSIVLTNKSKKENQQTFSKIEASPETQEEPPTRAPTYTGRFGQFYELVSLITEDRLDDENSAQFQALKWLVDDDPAQLELESTLAIQILERFTIATLYFSTNGVDWTSQYGFLSEASVCSWNDDADNFGVFCNSNGFVNRISIVSNNLSGIIPPELNHLPKMETIHLYYNDLYGPIPELDELTALESLDLDGNKLSGPVPESLFNLPALKNLFLLNNKGLTGTIPEISDQSQLESISFYNCSLSGSLPNSLGSVSNLKRIQFFDNELVGTIPSTVTMLPQLETIGLRGNNLVGSIPEFGAQTSLKSISLGENSLVGSLPLSLQDLTELEVLFLQDNNLDGPIPSSLGSLQNLRQLWLSNNNFEGDLPDLSANAGALTLVFLNGNNLEGRLDQFLQSAPTSISSLDVSENNFEGSISADIQRFGALKLLNASYCNLTGSLPTEIGVLSKAETFAVSDNDISGQIPTEIRNMVKLQLLDLSVNSLTGSVPSGVGNLWSLTSLDISNNQIGSEFPSRVAYLQNLERLSLHNNDITGTLNLFCVNDAHPAIFTADCADTPPEVTCSCCTQCFK